MKKSEKFIIGFLLGGMTILSITVCLMYFYIKLDVNVLKKLDDEVFVNNIQSSQVVDKLSLLKRYIDDEFYYKYNMDVEDVYKDFISQLDDEYSSYYSKDEYEILQSNIEGKYYGVGITLFYDDELEGYVVEDVLTDGSAYKAGIKSGDKLLEIDDVQITTMNMEEVTKLINGEKNTTVKLTIQKNSVEEYMLHRSNIIIDSVEWKVIDDDIGYICFSEFSRSTFIQYQSIVEHIKAQKCLIIDLRNNMGGSLETAIKILQDLMPAGTIVSLQNKNEDLIKYESDGKNCYNGKIVVIVNENTASAAEVFAAALQDNGFAMLIGENTYGKGVVQTVYKLLDGSAIKLTTGEYYTPNGRTIQGIGIQPDIIIINNQNDVQLEEAIKYLKSLSK